MKGAAHFMSGGDCTQSCVASFYFTFLQTLLFIILLCRAFFLTKESERELCSIVARKIRIRCPQQWYQSEAGGKSFQSLGLLREGAAPGENGLYSHSLTTN